jgi:hypothetical protein
MRTLAAVGRDDPGGHEEDGVATAHQGEVGEEAEHPPLDDCARVLAEVEAAIAALQCMPATNDPERRESARLTALASLQRVHALMERES